MHNIIAYNFWIIFFLFNILLTKSYLNKKRLMFGLMFKSKKVIPSVHCQTPSYFQDMLVHVQIRTSGHEKKKPKFLVLLFCCWDKTNVCLYTNRYVPPNSVLHWIMKTISTRVFFNIADFFRVHFI